MVIDTVKNTTLIAKVQSVHWLGKEHLILDFLNQLSRGESNFRPVKLGFYEPIKTAITWSSILEDLKWLFSEKGEKALFLSQSPVPGYFEINTERHPRQWQNGVQCSWDYAKAASHLPQAMRLIDETVRLFEADYAGMGVRGGKWNRIDMQNPEANIGSINGVRIPFVGISGIRWIEGLCWINVLGPKYIEFFGASVLESLPCYKCEFQNGGRHFRFQVTERPEEMFTDEGVTLVQEIKNRLGHPHAFLGNPINKSEGPLPPHRLQFDTPDFDFSEIRTPLKQA